MKNYRVAVIGRTGKGNYGHGLDVVWKAFSNVQIVAVSDENQAGGKAAAARIGARAVYTDYLKMLRDENPDIVSVAPRWLDVHHDMVIACAEAHASIFVEKPLARSLAEADAMLAACESRHVKLAINHPKRLSPVVLDVRERIRLGEIGQLIEIRGRGKEDARAGGEDMMVLGTHVFDLMRLFAGDPQWCFAHVTVGADDMQSRHIHRGDEGIGPLAGDGIAAVYSFANRVHGYFGSQLTDDKGGARFGLELRGSQGIMQVPGTESPPFLLRSNSWSLESGPGKAQWERLPSPEQSRAGQMAPSARIVADLMESIEQDRQPLSSGYDGRWALEMILSVYHSQRTGGRVALPLKERRHPLGG
jgi:predicted dehydrogenase